MNKTPLPIDEVIPQIINYLRENNTLILQATPGAGKTTRVPPSLLKVTNKNILVLEPRRLAARLSAHRVAQELQEECGNLVGYQVRFEKKESKTTRIKFITEGLFLRFLLSSRNLEEVGCVILDEFHERHVHADIALMLVTVLQRTTRPDLKLVIMSATLETKSLAEYLPQAKVFICETKHYPVTAEYISRDLVQKSLEIKVLLAVEKILKNPEDKGHILVFLPGRQDILRCEQKLQELSNLQDFKICKLSADTSFEEQQSVFLETSQRKIILSTNVAETSVTIEGVTSVIDSGLAKISGHAAWSGLSTLELKSISKSSCIQRSGRAGRTKAGHTLRLFTEYDYNLRPQFEVPEIQRVDLTQCLLEIKNLYSHGLSTQLKHVSKPQEEIENFPWFELPAANTIDSSQNLLRLLGALDFNKELTDIGKSLSNYPFHPRLSRLLYEGQQRKCIAQSLLIISLLSEGMIFKRNSENKEFSHSDIAYQIEILRKYFVEKNLASSINAILDKIQVKKLEKFLRKMCENFKINFLDCFLPLPEKDLSLILLSSFPDRVCKLRVNEDRANKKKLPEYTLCLGGGALLSQTSSVVEEEFILALVAEESLSKLQSHSIQIQFCHGIDKSILFFGPKEFISEKQEIYWNSDKQSACCVNRIYYGKVIVKEEQIYGKNQELENILHEELKKAWPRPFQNDEALQYFNMRIKIAEHNNIALKIPFIQDEEFDMFLCFICEGKKSFLQIADRELYEYLEEYIGYENYQKLNSFLPSHISVGKGRKIQIHYEEGKQPFISSRLQDFFGTIQTPRILNNKLPLVVNLLAPNMQSVQVTTDLAGFWERGYQEVRKELSRKYPRHSWPEDPKNAEPPDLVMKRRK